MTKESYRPRRKKLQRSNNQLDYKYCTLTRHSYIVMISLIKLIIIVHVMLFDK